MCSSKMELIVKTKEIEEQRRNREKERLEKKRQQQLKEAADRAINPVPVPDSKDLHTMSLVSAMENLTSSSSITADNLSLIHI